MTETYEVGQKIEVTVEKFTPIGVVVSLIAQRGWYINLISLKMYMLVKKVLHILRRLERTVR